MRTESGTGIGGADPVGGRIGAFRNLSRGPSFRWGSGRLVWLALAHGFELLSRMMRAFTAFAIAVGVFLSSSCKEGDDLEEASAPPSEARFAPKWVSAGEGSEAQPLAASVTGVADGKRFVRLGKEETGIEFHNQLDRKNIKNYLLSGAGLAVGDVDGNGLPDLFLVSQDGPNKLYMQRAPGRFEDLSEAAGIMDLKS